MIDKNMNKWLNKSKTVRKYLPENLVLLRTEFNSRCSINA